MAYMLPRTTRTNTRKLQEFLSDAGTEQQHTVQAPPSKKAKQSPTRPKPSAVTSERSKTALKAALSSNSVSSRLAGEDLKKHFAPASSLCWERRTVDMKDRVVISDVQTPRKQKLNTLPLPMPPDTLALQPTLDIDPAMLQLTTILTHRQPLGSKPAPRGHPSVWAAGRQELCETLPYYKSYQGGCYSNDGTVYSFMLDGYSQVREYMDQDVIICRAGGNMESDGEQLLQGKDHSMSDNQPQSVINNIRNQNPIIIICGNRNEASITAMPQRFCVLDWYKPTHVWAEKILGKGGRAVTTIRYRFERLDRSRAAWYAPQASLLTDIQRQSIPAMDSQQCHSCHEDWPTMMLSGWMCLNAQCDRFWRLESGEQVPYTVQYHPAFLAHETPWSCQQAPFDVNPGVPSIGKQIGDNLQYINTRGIVCPQCGRCNSRYLFTGWKCDNKSCDWSLTPSPRVVLPQNLHHNAWDIVSDGPALTKSVSKAIVTVDVRHTHNYKVSRYSIPGIDGCIIHAKANRTVVEEVGGPNAMFEALQREDIGLVRRSFGSETVKTVAVDLASNQLVAELNASIQQTELAEATSTPPSSLPEDKQRETDGSADKIETSSKDVETTTAVLSAGESSTMHIPQGLNTTDVVDVEESSRDPAGTDEFSSSRLAQEAVVNTDTHTVGLAQEEQMLDAPTIDPHETQSSTGAQAERVATTDPTASQSSTGAQTEHSISAAAIAPPSSQPDLEHTVKTPEDVEDLRAGRMQSFSMNFGMPYKFVAGGDSQSFDESAWPIRACRSRLNWALRTLLGDTDEFNELLAIGYMERQKIGYHDDGEDGLGPVIASLSLGAAATMSLRLKAKHFSGASKCDVFTFERPLPLDVLQSSAPSRASISRDQWNQRVAGFEELQRIKSNTSKGVTFTQRSKELPKEIGFKRRNALPLLDLHLTHGDIVVMQGEAIQKYFEHAVEPHGSLRFAMTCRQILPHHLTDEQRPAYQVNADTYGYDGSQIRRSNDDERIEW